MLSSSLRLVVLCAGSLLTASSLAQQPADLLPLWRVGEVGHDNILVADWDDDGRDDLAGYSELDGVHTLTVYLQGPDGRLGSGSNYPLPIVGPERRLEAVVNLDGLHGPDLIFLPDTQQFGNVEIISQSSRGVPGTTVVTLGPSANWTTVVVEDTGGDGDFDIVAMNGDVHDTQRDGELWLFDQQASFTFATSMIANGIALSFEQSAMTADIDGDGFQDFVFSDFTGNADPDFYVRYGDAGSTYVTELTYPQHAPYTKPKAIADFDGNGLLDILFAYRDTVQVTYQDSPRVFSAGQDISVFESDVAFPGDFNGDGRVDFLAGSRGRLSIYVQQSVDSFLKSDGFGITQNGQLNSDYRQVIAADLNSDGMIDIAGSATPGHQPFLETGDVSVYYNANGNYPTADAAVSVLASWDVRTSGTIVDYLFTTSNAGPATIDDGELHIELDYVLFLESDGDCEISLNRRYLEALTCKIAGLPSGGQELITVRVRAPTESDGSILTSVGAWFVALDEIDRNAANNLVETEHLFAFGNDITYNAPFEHIFFNEASGQLVVPAIRETTAMNVSVLRFRMDYDIGTFSHPDISEASSHIAWPRLKTGVARDVIPLVTDDEQEGREDFRVWFTYEVDSPPRERDVFVDASVFDDRPDLTAVGARLFEVSPSYIESEQTVTHAFEPKLLTSGDFNGDGLLDLLVLTDERSALANSRGLDIFLARGGGGLDPSPISFVFAEEAVSIAAGDLNHDGLDDVIVGLDGGMQFYLQSQQNELQVAQFVATDASDVILVQDIDGNGTDDIVSLANGGRMGGGNSVITWDNVEIRLQALDGTLTQPHTDRTSIWGGPHAAIGDVDGNGLADIAVARGYSNAIYDTEVAVIFQSSPGVFDSPVERVVSWPVVPHGGMYLDDIDVADLNGDGREEVLVNDVAIHFTNGSLDKSIDHLWLELVKSRQFIDINRDGLLDILAHEFDSPYPKLLVQRQPGVFDPMFPASWLTRFPSSTEPESLAVDLASDGDLDFIVAGEREKTTLIGTAMSVTANVTMSTVAPPVTDTDGETGSLTARITNSSDRRSHEATVNITSSTHAEIVQVLAAAGLCGIRRDDATRADCMMPELEPGGHIDFAVDFSAVTSGTADINIQATTLVGDIDPSDNSLDYQVDVTAAPPPPPPPPSPPPPPTSSSGGGGATDPLTLLMLLVTWRFGLTRRNEPAL